MIDLQLKSLTELVDSIKKESEAQIKKWGVQIRSSFEWMIYLTEEVGELAQAISELEYRKGTKEEVYKEAIQVATLALKIAEMTKEQK